MCCWASHMTTQNGIEQKLHDHTVRMGWRRHGASHVITQNGKEHKSRDHSKNRMEET